MAVPEVGALSCVAKHTWLHSFHLAILDGVIEYSGDASSKVCTLNFPSVHGHVIDSFCFWY